MSQPTDPNLHLAKEWEGFAKRTCARIAALQDALEEVQRKLNQAVARAERWERERGDDHSQLREGEVSSDGEDSEAGGVDCGVELNEDTWKDSLGETEDEA